MKNKPYSILRQGILLLALCTSTFAYPQYPKGYPDRSKDFDVLPGFGQPPKGYGNVPFYWWDWSKAEALRFYSGGMVYKKGITLDELHSGQE